MPIKELFEPAINHCQTGVPLDRFQAYDIKLLTDILRQDPEGRDVFFIDGQIKKEGDMIRMHKAADFLDYIRHEGIRDFYFGDIAKRISEDCQLRGGHLSREDFENYRVHVHAPMMLNWKNSFNSRATNPLRGPQGKKG